MKTRLRTALPTLALDRDSSIPIYRQLYEAYRQAILAGQLRKDAQLSSTRELAIELRISRQSVMNAFDQLLAEGYIRGEPGSGTFVQARFLGDTGLHDKRKSGYQDVPEDVLSREAIRIATATHMPASSPPIPFRRGLPAVDKFPLALWSRIVARCSRKMKSGDLNYTEPQGFLAFRCTIAEYLRNLRAVKCEPEQVFVVSGSQQGLQLIAHTLLNEGDPVCMEDPGYPGARSAFLAVGANVLPVPIDGEGMEVSKATQLPMPKLIYVTPSHQFPLGVTMSLGRRLSLLDWAARSPAWVVEDDYDSEFRFVSRPLSSLQGLSPDRVIYVGTFSKAMFPSLRLGYVVLPKNLVRAFSDSRRSNDFCAPFLTQAAMNEFIVEGHFARHLRRMRLLYAERQSAMLIALRREFGNHLQISNTDTGMDLVVWLPASNSDTKAAQLASRAGILTMPMSFFYSTPSKRGGLFLGFGAINQNQIREGVEKLRRALHPLLSQG
jgi:GntR family transcriptional regulator / MocR family aminotransferase